MPRPEKNIDWKRVDELLIAGCLGTEIAACYDMHPNTFYDRVVSKYNMSFTDYQQQKRSTGDSILREAQYLKAIKKLDNTMLIFLGKQRLGQKENGNDVTFSEDLINHFKGMMQQLASLQSPKKSEEFIHQENSLP